VARQESDRRFQAIFDQAAVGVSLSSADRWVLVNQKLCEILGYTRDELLQRNFRDVTHPDDLETTLAELTRLITNQVQTFTTEKRYIRKDGSPVWVSVTASALRLPSGEPQYGIAIVSDITERRRAEDALRRSEELNRRILDGVPGAIVHVSLEGRALQVNAIAGQILEIDEKHPESVCVTDFAHRVLNERGGELALADFPVSKCFETGEPQGPVTVGVRRSDGAVAWMILSALPITDLHTGELRSAVVTFVDITKRKQTEEELEELSYRYRNLLESITDGFFALDHSGRFTYVNPKAEELLQRPRAALIGTPVWEQFPEGIDSAFHKEYLRVMSERVPSVTEAYYPPLNRWFKSRAYPSQDGMSVLFEDITEQHAREITVMSDILHALNARFDVSDAFSEVAAGLRTLTGCDRSSVTLFDDDYEWGMLLALEQPEDGVHPGARLRLSELPATTDVLLGRPHLVRDMESYLDSPLVQRVYAAGFRSLLSLPLRNTHRVSGMLTLTWRVPDGANITHVPLLNQIADAVAMAVDKSRLFEAVRSGREQLEALSHRLLEVQETERRHIARELHDEIGQGLTGLKLVLDTVERLPPESLHSHLTDVHKLVNDLLTRVRNLSLDLRPGMLDDLGLLPALLWLFGRYTSQTNVRVAFEHSGLDRRFSPEVETAAYRIVQEALTNVARHAGVFEVMVRAWADSTAVTVQVIDAGAGFDPDHALHGGTTGGVTGMRERALLLGGQLTIESASGTGTRLSAELPLPGRMDGDEDAHQHPASR
jgi:PAS domain S-box-containing protein